MRFLCILTATIAGCSIDCKADSTGLEVPADAAAFRAEYQNALCVLSSELAEFEAIVHHIRPGHEATVQYFVDGDAFQSIQVYDAELARRPKGYPISIIRSESANTVFELSQRESGSQYSIAGLGAESEEGIRRYQRRYNKPIVLAATHLLDRPVSQIVESPSARLVALTSLENRDERQVLVEFDLDQDQFCFRRAKLYLLPDSGWRLRSYELYFDEEYASGPVTTVYRGSIEYAAAPTDGFLIPAHVKITATQDGMEAVVVEDATVTVFRRAAVDPARFTLDFYGLGMAPTTTDSTLPGGVTLAPADEPMKCVRQIAVADVELIPVPIANTGDRVLRILGAERANVCGRFGCMEVVNTPLTILPNSTGTILLRYTAGAQGKDSQEIVLVTDSAIRNRIRLQLAIDVQAATRENR